MIEGKGDATDRPRGRVLIVDDDPVCRELCRICLASAGYRVATARCAGAGIVRLRSFRADAVVSDWNLPDPAARDRLFRSCRRVCGVADPSRPAQPVLILMSAALPASCGLSFERVSGWLDKPFTGDALVVAVEKAVRGTLACLPRSARPDAVPERARRRFEAALKCDLAKLDRMIAAWKWASARELLHRLGGAAALCGHDRLARRCRRLEARCAGREGGSPPPDGWAADYLDLLRATVAVEHPRAGKG